MAEPITNKKIISFAGRNIDLDEFVRRAQARAVEWMDYQGLKGDERTDFLNSFNTKLSNIVSGQSGNSETSSTTTAVGGEQNNGTNYYGKSTGERKEDGKPRGGLFGTSRRNGFNPELNVDVYLNGIAGTIPTIEEQSTSTTPTSLLKPFSNTTMGNYVASQIFGEGNPMTNEQLAAWIDNFDKAEADGSRKTDGRRQFINQLLLQYRKDLIDGKYNISDEDKLKEIEKIDRIISPNISDWELGKDAPWMAGLLLNPTKKLEQTPVQQETTTLTETPAETIVEEAKEPQLKHDLKDEMTDADYARIGSIIGDIVSAGSAFVPGYGTAVSAVTGIGSTLANAYADFNDKSVTAGEAWANMGLGLGADVIGLIPGWGTSAKGYKIGKALAKIPWNGIIKWARYAGLTEASIGSLQLIYDKAVKGESLNSDDLKKLKMITSVGGGEARVAGAKRATKRVLQSAKKIEGKTTINTSKGRKVVDTETAEKVAAAKTKEEADKVIKAAAKTNPELEGVESSFGTTRVSITPWKLKPTNLTNPGRVGTPKEKGKVGKYFDLNPEQGNVYDFSNVKQRTSWFGRNFSDEALVAKRVDAVNYPGKPSYKAKLTETSGTPKTKVLGIEPDKAAKAVKENMVTPLRVHIKKATGIELDKTNPNSKVNLKKAIEDLKKAEHTDEQIAAMLTNKQFVLKLKETYKFKEGGQLIPKGLFGWLAKLLSAGSGMNTTGGAGYIPPHPTTTNTKGQSIQLNNQQSGQKQGGKKVSRKLLPGGGMGTTSGADTPLPDTPQNNQGQQTVTTGPVQGNLGNLSGNLGSLTGNLGGTTPYTPVVDTNPNGGKNNKTPGRQIGNPSDLALTGLELGKYFSAVHANNAILDKYKNLRPVHKINPRLEYRIWSPKPLLDLAQQAETDADNLGALEARGTNDLGKAFAYRLAAHFKGVEAARPYRLQADKEIKDSVNTAISIENDNQEKVVERVNGNHAADVAKFNQDRLAEIQRLHDNATKQQQLASTIQNGIARGAVASYENEYQSFLATDPEIQAARQAYRAAKARYDANPNDANAQRELTNLENALNNILTDKSTIWLSNHRQSLGYPFGPIMWTSPITRRTSFFAKGGSMIDKVERGRMKRHYDKLFFGALKLLITESNKKQRALGPGYAYFHKIMMQSK